MKRAARAARALAASERRRQLRGRSIAQDLVRIGAATLCWQTLDALRSRPQPRKRILRIVVA